MKTPEALLARLSQKLIEAYGQEGEHPEYGRDLWDSAKDGSYWDWVVRLLLLRLIQAIPEPTTMA